MQEEHNRHSRAGRAKKQIDPHPFPHRKWCGGKEMGLGNEEREGEGAAVGLMGAYRKQEGRSHVCVMRGSQQKNVQPFLFIILARNATPF